MSKLNAGAGARVVDGALEGGAVRRGGRSLLLLSTALGCSLLVIAAPGASRAASECGTGSTLTCAAGDYPTGITYTGVTDLNLTLSPGVTVENGVLVQGSGQLTLDASTDTDVSSAGGVGVRVDGGVGDVFVSTDSTASSADGGAAIFVTTTSGAATVISNTATTTSLYDAGGHTNDGVAVFTQTGAISIQSGTAQVVGNQASGVVGYAHDADITIESHNASSSGANGNSVYGYAEAGGAVSIVSGTATSSGAGNGAVVGIGHDGVTITSGTATSHGDADLVYADGIYGYSAAGDVSITSDVVETDGFKAVGIRVPAGQAITIDSGSITTHGDRSQGILVKAGAGDVSITSDTILTEGAGSHGIYVANAGGADIAGIGSWRAATGGTGALS
ncbi:MAG: hypothetical protein ACM3YN_10370, partial [Parcubacteria group bacterium]